MLNRTFSIKKDREISLLEARAGSIGRLFTNSLGRGRNSLERRALPTTPQKHSAAMPVQRSRRGENGRDGEPQGAEEGHVNGSDVNSSRNRAGDRGGDENGDDMNNDRTNNNLSGGRFRQNKRRGSPQHRSKHDLGPWTEAVSETVRSMGVAHNAIKDLQSKFELHADDLRTIEETKETLVQLRDECREKDGKIQRQATTITTLTSMDLETRKASENQREKNEQERQEIAQEKAKLEKRVATAIAEERLKLQKEFEKLVNEHGQKHDERKKELEDDFAAQRDEKNRQITTLEAEKGRLSTALKKQEAAVEKQAKELAKTTEQCDLLERAKDSFKRDLQDRERELDMLKKEFALSPERKEYFQRCFAEIYSAIEKISAEYFSNIDGKDLEKTHDALAAADSCFASVPIDDTEDSLNLRIAHAQRIISGVIYEYIWKPFRSDFTLSRPDFDDLLVKISDELEKSSDRTANVWIALTTRALQSLPADTALVRTADIEQPLRPSSAGRVERVVSKVFSILSPLVSSSQSEDLRTDLIKLTNSAIDVWNKAQTNKLKIIVNPSLKPENCEDWRYREHDPVPQDNNDEPKPDIMSKTRPRVFTLFPQVVALEATGPIKAETSLPGSFPSDSDQGPCRKEMSIHPGVGLPEWSPLVVRGKEEQEQSDEYLLKAIEDAKKKARSSRRHTMHERKESMGSVASSPPSPSQIWSGGKTNSSRSDL